ncbi:hypothetical protein L596_007183 [Steinernema carpocapsae]|uniref:Uncharacterized protein n=1 Tax=Steinernema carpocapsae TaxID=34508 RepID=A0A4U5P982_STECR|nr:hypothetical protein L596_007183 [Steinernema carpocapsae]
MPESFSDPRLRCYIASIIGDTNIRKQVQRTLFILQSLNVPFTGIDITQRGNQEERKFMQENAVNKHHKGVPLPPQFFVNESYIGDYIDFEEAVEENVLPEFLQLIPKQSSEKPEVDGEEDEDEEELEDEDEEEAEGEEEAEDEADAEEPKSTLLSGLTL